MYVELKTERLLLRPLGVGDLETVHEYASDRENTRYMLRLPNDTKEETLSFLTLVSAEWEKDEPDFFEFAVTLGGRQIGAVSVALDATRSEGEFGWIFDRRYHKRGYALEAATAVRDFAVRELKLKKLIAQCDSRNLDSFRLMQKIGLVPEDSLGERIYPKTGERAGEITCTRTY